MTPAISVTGLTRRYRDQLALDDVTLDLEPGSITGLLGRNGAGKTTLLRILAGHEFASAGTVTVLGASPVENETVLRQMIFVREDQSYPDLKVRQRVQVASWFYPNWSHELADELLEEFNLPLEPEGQEALPRDALGAGHRDRPGRPGRGDAVRRAVRGPGPGGPAAVLRPAARRLRRTPPDRAAVHPPDRRGRRAVRAGGGHRPGPDRAQHGRRRPAWRRDQRQRPGHRRRGVHRRAFGLGPAADRLAGVGGRGRGAGRDRPCPGHGAAPAPGTADAAAAGGPRRGHPGGQPARKGQSHEHLDQGRPLPADQPVRLRDRTLAHPGAQLPDLRGRCRPLPGRPRSASLWRRVVGHLHLSSSSPGRWASPCSCRSRSPSA